MRISDDLEWVYIDVKRYGQGYPRNPISNVFSSPVLRPRRAVGDWGSRLADASSREYHKGRIYVVDSEPGRGTTIRIAL